MFVCARVCALGVSAPPSTFLLPHSVTVAEDRGIVCAADRENAQVQCFDLFGNFQRMITAPQLGPALYAIAYDSYSGKNGVYALPVC